MNTKKGQAALEFLMTYGWAILVVLVAIGALAYFGVLNPSKYTSNSAISSMPAVGVQGGPLINTTTIAITLQNGAGYALNNVVVHSVPTGCSPTGNYLNSTTGTGGTVTTINVTDTSAFTAILNCTALSRVKGDIVLNYTNPNSGFVDKITVTVTGKV